MGSRRPPRSLPPPSRSSASTFTRPTARAFGPCWLRCGRASSSLESGAGRVVRCRPPSVTRPAYAGSTAPARRDPRPPSRAGLRPAAPPRPEPSAPIDLAGRRDRRV